MDAADTKTGRFCSSLRFSLFTPAKFASTTPGCARSYDTSVPTRSSQLLMLVVQSSDARQLLGTSYDGSISATNGARSASTPLSPTHCVGIVLGSVAKRDQ